MGCSILELVLRRLREAGFVAGSAYPGQKFPTASGVMASVHIEEVDRANLTVTMGVSILCPASMGGTACEVEALRATEILRMSRAVCVQSGCRYDGIAQVYVVEILATFTGLTDANDCKIWQGFYVYIDEDLQPNAISFSEEEVTDTQVEYVMGQTAPAGVTRGKTLWSISLEEMIPMGSPEPAASGEAFTLQIETDEKTERYTGCYWTSIRREITKQGLQRSRKGIAMAREEVK